MTPFVTITRLELRAGETWLKQRKPVWLAPLWWRMSPDSVYGVNADGTPVFHRVAPPGEAEIARVAARVALDEIISDRAVALSHINSPVTVHGLECGTRPFPASASTSGGSGTLLSSPGQIELEVLQDPS